MLIDKTNGQLDKIKKFAESVNDNSFKTCLESLKRIDNNSESDTELYCDFAEGSFYFVRRKEGEFRGNGGIIYHGKHDGFGSGSGPTFSVTLDKADGWRIHT